MTYRDLISILFRCLFIQGVWNYESMIGIGFCFCAIPVAKRLYTDEDKRDQFLRRHLSFFNAHPYFASFALGAIAKEEENSVNNDIDQVSDINMFKERMTGPLGVMGDRLFWDSIKPFAASLGVLIALTVGYLGAVVYLILYNIPHLYVRTKGLLSGYKYGFSVVQHISFEKMNKYIIWVKAAALLVAGLLIIAASHWSLIQGDSVFISFVVSLVAGYVLIKKSISVNIIILIIIASSLIIGWLFFWI
ncbi:MAG: PTS system mannose/fructose/sorbose family transporter subunit IID [candidate division KSB1 bacterium]|nr:PTS system mannose/fructose/sorbose family transporter subunit IID [candidate division KSB1 bacterium]